MGILGREDKITTKARSIDIGVCLFKGTQIHFYSRAGSGYMIRGENKEIRK